MTTVTLPFYYDLSTARKMEEKKFNKERRTIQEMFDYKPPRCFTNDIHDAFEAKEKVKNINEQGRTFIDIEKDYSKKEEPVNYPVKAGFATAADYISSFSNLKGDFNDHIEKVARFTDKKIISKRFNNNKFKFKSPEAKAKFIETIVNMAHASCIDGVYLQLDELNRPITYIDVQGDKSVDQLDQVRFYTLSKETFDFLRALYIETVEPIYDGGTVTVIDGVNMGGLLTRKVHLPVAEESAQAAFYPWMDGVTPEEYMQSFMDAKEQIALFYGIPGSGKSSLIKTGIAKLGINAIMCAKASLTGNAQFVTSLLKHLSDNKEIDLVVLEDADALMIPRSEGNTALNELLSAADGIGRMKFKLLLTSNADNTAGIDTALIRHGRAFDVMKFGRLSPIEANNARISIGLEAVNISKSVTLAQAVAGEGTPGMISAGNEDHIVVSSRFPLKTPSRNVE